MTGVIEALRSFLRDGESRRIVELYASDASLEAHLPHETLTRRGQRSIVDLLADWWNTPGQLVHWVATEYPSGVDITFERHPIEAARPWTSRQWHEVYVGGGGIERHVIWSDRPRHADVFAPLPDAIATVVGAVERRPAGDAGFSGSRLEILVGRDGSRYVLKHVRPDVDLLLRGTQDRGREAFISSSGILNGIQSIDTAVIAAAPEEDGWAILMRDVSPLLVTSREGSDSGGGMTVAERQQVLGAVIELHDGLQGRAVESAVSLADRLRLLGPPAMTAASAELDALPRWVSRSWRTFFDVAPQDVGDAITAIHEQPSELARELEHESTTLIHGDLWAPNIGIARDRVILLDWAQACVAPAEMEYAFWAVWNPEFTGRTSAELVEEARSVAGARVRERAMQLSLLAEFAASAGARAWAWYGTDGLDDDARAAERAELAWWISVVREVLEQTWAPSSRRSLEDAAGGV